MLLRMWSLSAHLEEVMASKLRVCAAPILLAALAVPATAAASGGPTPGSGGGGGGGGGGGATTTPVANPTPCATAVMTTHNNTGLRFTTGQKVTFQYNLTNCSTAGAETVAVSFSETGHGFSQDLSVVDAPCTPSVLTWSAPNLTINRGSTVGFSTQVPNMTCAGDSQQDSVTATFTDAVTGQVLATVNSGYEALPV